VVVVIVVVVVVVVVIVVVVVVRAQSCKFKDKLNTVTHHKIFSYYEAAKKLVNASGPK
jgi:hypothetical protein